MISWYRGWDKKISWKSVEVRYLGYVISSEGVATDPSKIEAVTQWFRPTSGSEVHSFLGFASYYLRLVEGFAKLAAALHRLVAEPASPRHPQCSGQDFAGAWLAQCQWTFEELTLQLTIAPELAYADFSLSIPGARR